MGKTDPTEWITSIQAITDVIGDDNIEMDVYGKSITIAEAKKVIRHFAKIREFRTFIAALRITSK